MGPDFILSKAEVTALSQYFHMTQLNWFSADHFHGRTNPNDFFLIQKKVANVNLTQYKAGIKRVCYLLTSYMNIGSGNL